MLEMARAVDTAFAVVAAADAGGRIAFWLVSGQCALPSPSV